MGEWSISIKQGVVLVQFASGTLLTKEKVMHITNMINSQAGKYRNMNAVWDMRNIVTNPHSGFHEMYEVAENVRAHWQSEWLQNKLAIVTASLEIFGLARMFTSLAENKLSYKVAVFENDLPGAIAWANLPASSD